MTRTRHFIAVAAALAALAAVAVALAPRTPVSGLQPDGGYLVPTGQTLTPAGAHIEVSERPLGMVLSPDGRFLAVVTGSRARRGAGGRAEPGYLALSERLRDSVSLDEEVMDKWENIAERKIREAMAEGAFDNLEGKGRPLDLKEDPYEDPSLRMAHRLLRNNGFAPAWIEEAKDLEHAIERARRDLARAVAGKESLDRLRAQIAEINRRILAHNLKTPSTQFHMRPLDAEGLIGGSEVA